MKLRKYFSLLAVVAFVALIAGACVKPNEDFSHSNSAITGIEIYKADGTGNPVAGVIDEVTGEIFFPILNKNRDLYDLTKLMVRANIEYDAYITPSLDGLWDLSDPDNRPEITVTAGNGSTRTYTLWAFYTRR